MKDTLSDLIERVLENASNDFSEMSNDDIIREKELAEELESYLEASRGRKNSSHSDICNRELENRDSWDQEMEDRYMDGYTSRPNRTAADAFINSNRLYVQSRPLGEEEKADSMFQSLRSRK